MNQNQVPNNMNQDNINGVSMPVDNSNNIPINNSVNIPTDNLNNMPMNNLVNVPTDNLNNMPMNNPVNNIPTSSVNPAINSVPPIAEVKVEATSNNTVITDTVVQPTQVPVNKVPVGNNGQPSGEPPKNSKVSTVLLILLFVFLFAFVMGMPYIREFMNNLKKDVGLSPIEQAAREEEKRQQQEEEKNKPKPTPESEKTKELVCTSTSSVVGNYTLVETQKFYYNSKNKVLSSKYISNYSFTTLDDTYNGLVQRCNEDSLKYLTHDGYTMSCSNGDSVIEISHEFDLKTFKPIVEGTTNIQANASYKQDLNEIKTNLINQGYSCE